MVRLFFENSNLEGPVVSVRWCVDKIDLDALKNLHITKPYLALIIAKKSDYYSGPDQEGFEVVDCKAIPLDQSMESYFEFRNSGELRVFGKLVWCQDYSDQGKNERSLVEKLNGYKGNSVDFLFERLNENNFSSSELDHGYADVVVPEGHFAKEPSEWEKWWVNFWYESKPKNQCQFRKRRMLAYSIQPFVVVPYMLLRSLLIFGQVLILASAGMRGIHFGSVFHPFSCGIADWDVISEKSTSVFARDSSGNERKPIFLLLMPAIQIAIWVIATLLWLLASLLFNSIGATWIWFVVLNVLIVVVGFFLETGVFENLFPEETDAQREARIKKEFELRYAEYQDMVCLGVPLKADVSALPAKRRTFYLKFKNLKRRVCLPFAG